MSLHNLARKVKRNVEDYGLCVTAKMSLTRLLSPVCVHRVYRIYRRDLKLASPQRESGHDDFTFKTLSTTDHRVIEQIEDYAEGTRGKIANKIAAGGLCLVALRGEQLAGFNLITFGEVFIPAIQLTRTFRPGEAWGEWIAVRKDFRRRGLASQIRYRVFNELRKRGIKRLYGGASRSNVPSLRLARKVGYRELVDVHYTRVLLFEQRRFQRVQT